MERKLIVTSKRQEVWAEKLGLFKFNEQLSFYDIWNLFIKINNQYRSFSMNAQISRIYMLPYIITFYTKDVIIMRAFIEFYELVKKVVLASTKYSKDEASPRLIINNGLVVMDFYPNNKLRHSYHLYSTSRQGVLFIDDEIEELGEYQEAEIRVMEGYYKLIYTG